MSPAKTTIIWDVDDVLNQLTRCWFDNHWLPSHPECRLTWGNVKENPPHRLLGTTRQHYLDSLDAFRLAEYSRLEPRPEILAWFRLHGRRCRHQALTAAPRIIADQSAAWVMRHFGDWIRTYHFVPSPRPHTPLPLYDSEKGDYLRDFPSALFVDDHPENIVQANRHGLRTFLFPCPWNNSKYSIDVSASSTPSFFRAPGMS